MGPLRPRLRPVARQHLRQALGRGERRRGQGRPHQQRPALQHRGIAGRGPERSRPVLVHLAAVDVPEAGRSRHRHRPGGQQEARADVEGREEEHLQPEDEAVLRLPGRLCARSGAVPTQLPAGSRASASTPGRDLRQGSPEAQGDRPSRRPRHVERDRLQHDADVPPLLLRRVHPERGEPDRHRPGREQEGRDRGADRHARHLSQRHVRRGLRVDGRVEQPGVPRRPAVGGAERDLDRALGRELREYIPLGRHLARRRSRAARTCAWATSTSWASS